MPELTASQVARLMEIARQINLTVDELRDAAASSLMHDAKTAARSLYLQIRADNILPSNVRQELAEPLEAAWGKAVAGGVLFERTHGAITHLIQADQYLNSLLVQRTLQ